jgi:hypothetical protein
MYQFFYNYFDGIELHRDHAHKISHFGRAIGGSLVGYRSYLSINVMYQTAGEKKLIKVNLDDRVIYIVPTYINYNCWKNDFNTSKELINQYNVHI